MKFLSLILTGFLLLNSLIFPQGDSSVFNIERFWNNALEDNLTDVNDSELSDDLENLSARPVDINSAQLEDLLRIPFLNYQDAKSIIEYRNKSGKFFSVYELRQIKGLSNLLINNILPYIDAGSLEVIPASANTLMAKPDLSTIPKVDLRIRILSNSLYNKGVTAATYTGTPIKLYNRLKVCSKDRYQMGLTLEKDAGETSFADFNSFHLMVNSLKPFETVLIGDYSVEFGQGLALWSPYGYLKDGNAVSSRHRQKKDIKPYTSTDENSFLRGGAVTFSFNGFKASAFYSGSRRDANLDSASGSVTSFYTSGYHRTLRESQKKDKVKEVLFGAGAELAIEELLEAGILFYRSEFSHPFLETSALSLSGKRFDVFSLSCKLFLNRLYFSGEAALGNKKPAFNSSLEFIITEEINALISFRHYPSGFPSMHSFSSGSSSGCARQETGIYGGINIRSFLGTIDLFYDQFKKQKTGSMLPVNGNKFGLSYTCSPFRKLKLNLRYRNGDEEICDLRDPFSGTFLRQSRTFKGELSLGFTGSLYVKLHGSIDRYLNPKSGKKESGLVLYEETGISRSVFSLSARIAYFRTDSYYSRIFQLEYDTPGSLVNSSLFGSGVKWFINIQGRIFSKLSASMKYSETYRSGGSNPAEEENNYLSFQLDIKL
ncbi:MAG: ComEA family DNA-binding protein [Syntrophomonadaceae bacterium]